MLAFLKSIPWPRWYGVGLFLLVAAVGIIHSWAATDLMATEEGWATSIGLGDRLLSTLIWAVGGIGAAAVVLFLPIRREP